MLSAGFSPVPSVFNAVAVAFAFDVARQLRSFVAPRLRSLCGKPEAGGQ
jgi:hypothetical protein